MISSIDKTRLARVIALLRFRDTLEDFDDRFLMATCARDELEACGLDGLEAFDFRGMINLCLAVFPEASDDDLCVGIAAFLNMKLIEDEDGEEE